MRLQQSGERAHKRRLVLDQLNPTDCSDHDPTVAQKAPGQHPCRLLRDRSKTLGVDSVVDLAYPRRRNADTSDQITLEVLRYGHVSIDQRTVQPAEERGFPVITGEI